MEGIITATIVWVAVIICTLIVCNTAINIAELRYEGNDASALKAVQDELDEAYKDEQATMLTLNNVLEALDDEYGKEERNSR